MHRCVLMRTYLLTAFVCLACPSIMLAQDTDSISDSSFVVPFNVSVGFAIVSFNEAETRLPSDFSFPQVNSAVIDVNGNLDLDRWRPSIGLRFTQVPFYMTINSQVGGGDDGFDQRVIRSFRYAGCSVFGIQSRIFHAIPIHTDFNILLGYGISWDTYFLRGMANERSFYIHSDPNDPSAPNILEANYWLQSHFLTNSSLIMAGIEKVRPNGHKWTYHIIWNLSKHDISVTSVRWQTQNGYKFDGVYQPLTFLGMRLEYVLSKERPTDQTLDPSS